MICCVLSLLYYFLCAVFTIVLVLISTLVISEKLRKALFAKVFTSNAFKQWVQNMFRNTRPIWLKDFSEIKFRKPNEKLNILEVGVGYGANFELYPENCRLTVLDYNDNFKDTFMERIKTFPEIEFNEYLTGSVEDMNAFADNTFDVVLITHVFCSVTDVAKGVKEVKRVLKKDGKYFFMEHVGYHQASFFNNLWTLVQYALEPLWKIIFGGCCLKRQNWVHIQNAGFKSVKINYSYPENVVGFLRPQIWGCAIK